MLLISILGGKERVEDPPYKSPETLELVWHNSIELSVSLGAGDWK